MVAEPFLNTSRGVQDLVDNTAECVQLSRNRLSCTDFMSSAALNTLTNDDDIESNSRVSRGDYDQSKKSRRFSALSNYVTQFCACLTTATTSRALHFMTMLISLGIIMIVVYASFTV